MIKLRNNMQTGIRIFTIMFLSAFFVQYYPETKILVWVAITFSIIYLILGWYIFRSYFPEGSPPLLFLMGYLYSGVFLASVFVATGWPLSTTMTYFSPIWALVQIIIIITIRKKLSRESFIQFLIEAGLLLILSVFLVAKM